MDKGDRDKQIEDDELFAKELAKAWGMEENHGMSVLVTSLCKTVLIFNSSWKPLVENFTKFHFIF